VLGEFVQVEAPDGAVSIQMRACEGGGEGRRGGQGGEGGYRCRGTDVQGERQTHMEAWGEARRPGVGADRGVEGDVEAAVKGDVDGVEGDVDGEVARGVDVSAVRTLLREVSRYIPVVLSPTPYTLHPTPCTLHPAPCTLLPTSHTLHPTSYTLCNLDPGP
jgi:hypothetical protein